MVMMFAMMMMMELVGELLLIALLSLVCAFLLAKFVSMASPADLEHDSTEKLLSGSDLAEESVLEGGKGGGAEKQQQQQQQQTVIDDRELKNLGVEGFGGDDVGVVEIFGDSVKVDDGGFGAEKDEKEEKFVGSEGFDGDLVEERVKEVEVGEIELELVQEEQRLADYGYDEVNLAGSFEELVENVEIEGGEEKGGVGEKGGWLNDEDDWEGIERSDLEELFGAAAAFVGSGNGDVLSKFDSDVQMQLYGLYKIATEGPCYEHQPLALKVAARAKWHAWQQLGKMNPEEAMEQYVTLLSERIPEWMGGKPGGSIKQEEGSNSSEAGVSGTKAPDISSFICNQLISENESEGGKPVGNRKSFEQGPPMTDDFSAIYSLQPQGHY